MSMKTILCYGDSLTWGANAQTGGRHAREDLWPTVLGARLGSDVNVINAGLGGRTTMFDDYSAAADKNGVRVLPTMLGMFDPLDLVVLMLGSNDLKTFIGGSAVAAAQGMRRLVEVVRSYPYEAVAQPPLVLIVSPPLIVNHGPTERFPLLSPRVAESGDFAANYRVVAAATGAAFFDAGSVATATTGGDGVHLDAANTRAIGEALAPVVQQMLGIGESKAA
jgi:lysophospholipase L1-like esterase